MTENFTRRTPIHYSTGPATILECYWDGDLPMVLNFLSNGIPHANPMVISILYYSDELMNVLQDGMEVLEDGNLALHWMERRYAGPVRFFGVRET